MMCKFCGTKCDFYNTRGMFSAKEFQEVRYRHSMGKIIIVECEYCAKRNLKWSDERIKCGFCGEMI